MLFWILATTNYSTLFLFIFLFLLALLEQFLAFNVGMITSSFYKILGDKDLSKFWMQTIKSLMYVLAIAFVMSAKDYTSSTLYLSWREILTKKLHKLYFFSDFYYKLNVLDDVRDTGAKVDNPDQRITQDVDKMCNYFSQTAVKILIAPIVIGYYSVKSYSITGNGR